MHLGKRLAHYTIFLHYTFSENLHKSNSTSTCKFKQMEDKWMVNLAQSDERVGIVLSYFCKKIETSWLDQPAMGWMFQIYFFFIFLFFPPSFLEAAKRQMNSARDESWVALLPSLKIALQVGALSIYFFY